MYQKPASHKGSRIVCLLLALLTAATMIGGGLPPIAAAEDTSPIPRDRTAFQSGDVCIPAGDGLIPVALAGVSARGAVLLEADSGDVIFGQNQHARLPMASTTKIMTALVALEELSPDTVITVTADTVGVEGSSIYLAEGEQLTLEELLYALLLESANDAAETIAVAVAGSVADFAALMNEKATKLGLKDTHFVNPHGLDDPAHYTTAYELAMIARAALQNPAFRKICGTRRRVIPLQGDAGARLLLNHNKLLDSYEGCIGVKTGFTKRTGRCLVSAAEREGVTLIAVTLNAPDDWRDHTAMLDYGFGLYESIILDGAGFSPLPLWVVSCDHDYVMLNAGAPQAITLRRDHGPIVCVVEIPRFAFAPIGRGQPVGRLVFYEQNRNGLRSKLGEIPLSTAYEVEEITYPPTLWERLTAIFT